MLPKEQKKLLILGKFFYLQARVRLEKRQSENNYNCTSHKKGRITHFLNLEDPEFLDLLNKVGSASFIGLVDIKSV